MFLSWWDLDNLSETISRRGFQWECSLVHQLELHGALGSNLNLWNGAYKFDCLKFGVFGNKYPCCIIVCKDCVGYFYYDFIFNTVFKHCCVIVERIFALNGSELCIMVLPINLIKITFACVVRYIDDSRESSPEPDRGQTFSCRCPRGLLNGFNKCIQTQLFLIYGRNR